MIEAVVGSILTPRGSHGAGTRRRAPQRDWAGPLKTLAAAGIGDAEMGRAPGEHLAHLAGLGHRQLPGPDIAALQ
jgi:hypothetical protein